MCENVGNATDVCIRGCNADQNRDPTVASVVFANGATRWQKKLYKGVWHIKTAKCLYEGRPSPPLTGEWRWGECWLHGGGGAAVAVDGWKAASTPR